MDEINYMQDWNTKQRIREDIRKKTEDFIKSGGVIHKVRVRGLELISYHQILERYDIKELDLRRRIAHGRFAPPMTDSQANNRLMEHKKWMVQDVEMFLRHGKTGWGYE